MKKMGLVLGVFLLSFSVEAAKRPIRAIEIKSGAYSSCALLETGVLKCWGSNTNGTLGRENTNMIGSSSGTMGDQLSPINLGKNKKVLSFATGHYHACAILDDGSLKCWGLNNYGQLGYEDTANRGDRGGTMGDNLG